MPRAWTAFLADPVVKAAIWYPGGGQGNTINVGAQIQRGAQCGRSERAAYVATLQAAPKPADVRETLSEGTVFYSPGRDSIRVTMPVRDKDGAIIAAANIFLKNSLALVC